MTSDLRGVVVTSDLRGVGAPEALDVDVVLAERWEVQEGDGGREVQLQQPQQLLTALPADTEQTYNLNPHRTPSNPTLLVKPFKTTTVDHSALQSQPLNHHKYKTRNTAQQDNIFSTVT